MCGGGCLCARRVLTERRREGGSSNEDGSRASLIGFGKSSSGDVDELDYDVLNRLRTYLRRLPPVVDRKELKRHRDRVEKAVRRGGGGQPLQAPGAMPYHLHACAWSLWWCRAVLCCVASDQNHGGGCRYDA